MARLREGRANTGRSAGHFLRETVSRVRARRRHGPAHDARRLGLLRPLRRGHVPEAARCATRITVRQHRGLRALIEAIPEEAWTPIPYWIDGGADVAETVYTPFAEREGRASRCGSSCAGCKPTPGSQLGPLHDLRLPRLHHRPRRRHARARGRPSPPRRGRERHPGPQGGRRPQPPAVGPVRRQRRLAGGRGDGPRPGALDGPHRPGRGHRDHAGPSAGAASGCPDGSPARPAGSTLHLPARWPWAERFLAGARDGSGPSPSRPDRRLAAPGPRRGMSDAAHRGP